MQTCKFVAVGDGAVGKTAIMLSYTSNSTPSDYQPTVFDNYNAITMFDEKPVSMCCWDTAGQDDYDHLRYLSYPQTDCFILCFSLISPVSFSNITSKWVPELRKHCPDVPILLVGTKLDLRSDKNHLAEMQRRGLECITTQQGMKLAQDVGACGYVECSAITQENLKQVFDSALLAWAQHREAIRRKQRKQECCNIM